jgi:hypothetical protein
MWFIWPFVLYYPLLILASWLGDKPRPSKYTNIALGAAMAMPLALGLIGIGQVFFAALH